MEQRVIEHERAFAVDQENCREFYRQNFSLLLLELVMLFIGMY